MATTTSVITISLSTLSSHALGPEGFVGGDGAGESSRDARPGGLGLVAEESSASLSRGVSVSHSLLSMESVDTEEACLQEELLAAVANGSLHPMDHDAFVRVRSV